MIQCVNIFRFAAWHSEHYFVNELCILLKKKTFLLKDPFKMQDRAIVYNETGYEKIINTTDSRFQAICKKRPIFGIWVYENSLMSLSFVCEFHLLLGLSSKSPKATPQNLLVISLWPSSPTTTNSLSPKS